MESALFEPDAVVLDLGLPKLDGVEVARRLRSGGDVPILMLTARDSLEARVEGLDSGANSASSRSNATSCWRACARCCAAGPRAAVPSWLSATCA